MSSRWSRISQQIFITCNGRCNLYGSSIAGRLNCWTARIYAKRYYSGTHLYSAVLADERVADGGAKTTINNEWGNAFAKTKEDFTILKEASQKRARRPLRTDPLDIDTIDENLEARAQKDQDEPFIQESETQWEGFISLSMETVLKYPTEPGTTRPPLPATTVPVTSKWGVNDLPPQSLWSGEMRRQKSFARKMSIKKAAITEVAAMRLILRLMHLVQLSGCSKRVLDDVLGYESQPALHTYAQVPSDKQKMLIKKLADYTVTVLHPLSAWEGDDRFGFPIASPNYRKHGKITGDQIGSVPVQAFVFRQLKDMNYRLYRHFQAYTSQEISFERLVARICDVLLHATVPPNIDTLNILLLGFQETNSKEEIRAEVVAFLRSFQSWTTLRVNELYCAAILRQYRRQDDLERFSDFISLMRGRKNGLMLAKPDISISEACNGRLIRRANGKVNQAVHPMPIMYWEMVKGVLHFAGFNKAMEICKSLKTESWGLDWQCIDSLMTDCIRRASWIDGKMVWEEVLLLGQKTKEIPKWILTAFLALYRICNREEEYETVLREAVARGHQESGLKVSVLALLRKFPPATAGAHKETKMVPSFRRGNPPLQMTSIVTLENLVAVEKRSPNQKP